MKNCCDWSREVARIVKVERKKKKNEKKREGLKGEKERKLVRI